MSLRSFLLAGAMIPLAFWQPAVALDRVQKPLVLAQTEEPQPCPEGQECPPPPQPEAQPPAEEQPPAEQPPAEAAPAEQPAEQPPAEQPPAEAQPPAEQAAPEQPAPEQPAPEQPAAEQPPAEQPPAEQPPAEQPPAEQPPAEAAPAEQPPAEQPPAAEQPAPEQPAPEQPAAEQPAPEQPATEQTAPEQPAAEQPAPEQPAAEQTAPAQPTQERTLDRARRRQQQLQGQQPAPQEPAQQQAVTPPAQEAPPAPEQSTVEQQLEAQGDTEQADKVRSLRDQLLQQLQQAIAPTPEPQQQQQGANNRRDRRGDSNQGGNRNGWWNRDQNRGDVVEERGGRIVIDLGGGNIYVEPVVPDEGDRLLYGADNVEVQQLPRGRTRTIVHRPDGVDIVTIRDRNGGIVKRSRFLPDGREIVLIDNRYPDEADFQRPPSILHDVPPPRVRIPRDRYIVDLGRASDDDIRYALQAPLVQPPPRPYTLDEVLRNQEVRAYSPRIDLDSITFEFGSATISNDQMSSLYELGRAMEQVIADNPDEVYLIEGHTDAVGSDYDNLILSDQRAEAVATALSQNFDIPPENLVTEGYGEQFLKIDTQGPERRNRRATVRRLTELLQAESQ
jgi:outer membrane protein OmpA-like peptidoglycan-associated protein